MDAARRCCRRNLRSRSRRKRQRYSRCLLSTAKAERVDGGYRFTGRKQFGSLTPVWTRFGLHGMDTSDPSHPKIVHAFMPRDSSGYIIKETWDVLGMRATRSDDTVLENAFIPDRYVARIVPAGGAGIDAFVLSVFAWALLGFANVYYGLASALWTRALLLRRARVLSLSPGRWLTIPKSSTRCANGD
jgi:alkylation response protein AidB-like acyl-CoA dehydrogenase